MIDDGSVLAANEASKLDCTSFANEVAQPFSQVFDLGGGAGRLIDWIADWNTRRKVV